MKKLILSLLTVMLVVTMVSYGNGQTTEVVNHRAEVQTMASVPSSSPNVKPVQLAAINTELLLYSYPSEETAVEAEQEEDTLWPINDDIPLSYDEQKALQSACEEFDIPYALALGLIEKETHFQNVVGDDGASTGYMQIQARWHYDRMERLGVTDLSDPSGNFRVGCDFLSELYDNYGDWGLALTVYNMGHNPGYITNYAYDILNKYEVWIGVVGTNE